jgi:hypothetical protein
MERVQGKKSEDVLEDLRASYDKGEISASQPGSRRHLGVPQPLAV